MNQIQVSILLTAILIDALIKELTEEYSMTTIVNTHDMNSVMEIGEKIIFISDGIKCWEGNKNEILNSDCETLNDFVFANSLQKTQNQINIRSCQRIKYSTICQSLPHNQHIHQSLLKLF